METITVPQLRELMERFVTDGYGSQALAGEIEVAIDELFGDEEPFSSVALALASYRPEGGPFLYGKAVLTPMVLQALDALRAREIR